MTDTHLYVHGYDSKEAERLADQASALQPLIHAGTRYPAGSRVLEAGCGTGAQTVSLARNSPGAQIVSVDRSAASLADAEARVRAAGLTNVQLLAADIMDLPFAPASFDHVFVCFVLEHLADPAEALRRLQALLRPGGTITIVEGDHGSTALHPDSDAAQAAVATLVALQRSSGGDANIGRRLYPLLRETRYTAIRVAPLLVYIDGSMPEQAEAFTRRTFAAMVEGIGPAAIEAGLIDGETFAAGVRALHRAAEPDGVFAYTFFKAVATTA
ncbi:class I SAM-dependent methyltransferase [Allosphingosinicella deserti]|uniref:SAM-dependent methyltransferase n=1 Tax=Allosphingosinicella deserti TaxID=2116704 RepID=A0A2P7QRR5_9SPHN|nr:methyltransferase domain-containing protein [Sphingomonas deserti]PSJ40668.1 SAM-dependent methyltransferase [Sphingomonas deserti]